MVCVGVWHGLCFLEPPCFWTELEAPASLARSKASSSELKQPGVTLQSLISKHPPVTKHPAVEIFYMYSN